MTITPDTPDICDICTRQATGLGLAPDRRGQPIRWLCQECTTLLEFVHSIKRPSVYELAARTGGMDAAGPLIEEFGSDLGEYTEEQALRLVGAIWRGCADRMRELVREGSAPF